MSFRRSARQYVRVTAGSHQDTKSLFVQNHTSPTHLLVQVDDLVQRGELKEARELIECIIENNHQLVSRADLFVLHSQVFLELEGFHVDAQCSLQQALMLEPQNQKAQALQSLVEIHEELRDGLYNSAEDRLRNILSADSENVYALYLLGNHLFWKNGGDQEAVDLLEKCVSLRPSFLRAWLSLAMAYKKAKSLQQAEEAFQECLSLDSNVSNHSFYKNHLQSL